MLLSSGTCAEVRHMPAWLILLIIGFYRVRIDRHLLAGRGREKNDLRLAAAAANNPPLVGFGSVIVEEAHESIFRRASAALATSARSSSCA